MTLIVIYDKTEVQTSNILHIAQQTVNAIKKKALEHLKTQMEVI